MQNKKIEIIEDIVNRDFSIRRNKIIYNTLVMVYDCKPSEGYKCGIIEPVKKYIGDMKKLPSVEIPGVEPQEFIEFILTYKIYDMEFNKTQCSHSRETFIKICYPHIHRIIMQEIGNRIDVLDMVLEELIYQDPYRYYEVDFIKRLIKLTIKSKEKSKMKESDIFKSLTPIIEDFNNVGRDFTNILDVLYEEDPDSTKLFILNKFLEGRLNRNESIVNRLVELFGDKYKKKIDYPIYHGVRWYNNDTKTPLERIKEYTGYTSFSKNIEIAVDFATYDLPGIVIKSVEPIEVLDLEDIIKYYYDDQRLSIFSKNCLVEKEIIAFLPEKYEIINMADKKFGTDPIEFTHRIKGDDEKGLIEQPDSIVEIKPHALLASDESIRLFKEFADNISDNTFIYVKRTISTDSVEMQKLGFKFVTDINPDYINSHYYDKYIYQNNYGRTIKLKI